MINEQTKTIVIQLLTLYLKKFGYKKIKIKFSNTVMGYYLLNINLEKDTLTSLYTHIINMKFDAWKDEFTLCDYQHLALDKEDNFICNKIITNTDIDIIEQVKYIMRDEVLNDEK